MVGTAPNSGDCTAYWKLDETTGTTATDIVNANNGTASSSTIFTDEVGGIVNNGADLDNWDKVITVSDSTDLKPALLSTSCWVYLNALPAGGSSSESGPYNAFGKISGATGYMMYIDASDKYTFFLYGLSPNQTGYGTQSVVAINTWYHLVSTYDGSNVKLYIDSVLVANVAVTGTPTYNTADFLMGKYLTKYIDGIVDEVATFDVGLTQANVDYLYNGGSPTTDQQYPFSSSPTVAANALSFGVNF